MSALPPKADMCSASAHVCYGPKADITVCFKKRRPGRQLRRPGLRSQLSRAKFCFTLLLTGPVLHHLLNLPLHRLEVEGSRVLHRRVIDCGLRQLCDVLLDHDEAPELAGEEVVAVTEGAGVRRLATGSGCSFERILANVDQPRHVGGELFAG